MLIGSKTVTAQTDSSTVIITNETARKIRADLIKLDYYSDSIITLNLLLNSYKEEAEILKTQLETGLLKESTYQELIAINKEKQDVLTDQLKSYKSEIRKLKLHRAILVGSTVFFAILTLAVAI